MASDSMKDEEVLRFTPPEIRRIWRRIVAIEEQMGELRAALQRIEDLLRSKAGGA
jgi:hypothetical protein